MLRTNKNSVKWPYIQSQLTKTDSFHVLSNVLQAKPKTVYLERREMWQDVNRCEFKGRKHEY